MTEQAKLQYLEILKKKDSAAVIEFQNNLAFSNLDDILKFEKDLVLGKRS